jgi:hypothetical protein
VLHGSAGTSFQLVKLHQLIFNWWPRRMYARPLITVLCFACMKASRAHLRRIVPMVKKLEEKIEAIYESSIGPTVELPDEPEGVARRAAPVVLAATEYSAITFVDQFGKIDLNLIDDNEVAKLDPPRKVAITNLINAVLARMHAEQALTASRARVNTALKNEDATRAAHQAASPPPSFLELARGAAAAYKPTI